VGRIRRQSFPGSYLIADAITQNSKQESKQDEIALQVQQDLSEVTWPNVWQQTGMKLFALARSIRPDEMNSELSNLTFVATDLSKRIC